MNQADYIQKLCSDNQSSVVIGSIGTISYDLKEIDHPKKILVKGAMGHALGIGFGYALGSPTEDVIVLIGDGSYLMKAGSASTILKHGLPNLRIVVLNNRKYKSCGGQSTNFESIRQLVPFEIVDVE